TVNWETNTGEIFEVDYVAADLWRLEQYQIAFKNDRDALKRIVIFVERTILDRKYSIIEFKNGVILLQKGAESNPIAMTAWLKFRQKLEPIMKISQ
ncbi:MAG: hypothetical protein ACFBSE_26620, partial [Prochloraceae cyanobacterium]